MLEIGRTDRGPARLMLTLWSGMKLLVQRDEPPAVAPDLSEEERESILATGCYTIGEAETKPPQAPIPKRRRAPRVADDLGTADDQIAREELMQRLGEEDGDARKV